MPNQGDTEMDFNALKELGKKTRKFVEKAKKVKEGENAFSFAEKMEEEMRKEGVSPAFPINISFNEEAAHNTPDWEDESLIEGLVKIDLGLWKDSAITDTAITLDFTGEFGFLVDAVEEALEEAVASIRPGKRVGEISRTIERVLEKHGVKPISNLTGHKIEPYNLHAGISIPSVGFQGGYEFKEGDVFAVEPFATLKDGSGIVKDRNEVKIFSLINPKIPMRVKIEREIISFVKENYGPMPFAERWLRKRFESAFLLSQGIKFLVQKKALSTHPVLVEGRGKPVAQAEHTIYIDKDSAIVIV